jgi:hypothetical protein
MRVFRRMVAVIGLAALVLPIAVAVSQSSKPTLSSTYADPAQPDISGLWVVTGAMYFAPDRAVPKLKGEYQALYRRWSGLYAGGCQN